jgi:hypothetical protein
VPGFRPVSVAEIATLLVADPALTDDVFEP